MWRSHKLLLLFGFVLLSTTISFCQEHNNHNNNNDNDYDLYDDGDDEQHAWVAAQQHHALQQEQQYNQQQQQQQRRLYEEQVNLQRQQDQNRLQQEQQHRQSQQQQPAAAPPRAPVYQPLPQTNVGQPPNRQQLPQQRDPQVIRVPRLGNVRGLIAYKTIKNRRINAFLGLKYATVGNGIARFQKANALPQSDIFVDATREAPNCPQFPDLEKVADNEARGIRVDDCLTLNIYAPSTGGLLPVIVFVHGEMLFDGGAEEGQPDYFMEQDVVLVSVNYRLAPFGFLTTLSDAMPGNVALADIHMALEWVQQHISAFGGNPQQVMLFGQAGGATLVHALSLSGRANGLFDKLILQSGTALNPYFLDEQPVMTARSMATVARCAYGNRGIESLNHCFGNLTTTELLQTFKRHWEENEPRGIAFTGGFKLVVGDRLGYLQQNPAALVASNTYPVIAGVTKDAGAFIMSRFYNQLQQIRSNNISDYINVVLKHTTQSRHHQLWRNWALQHIFTEADARNPSTNTLSQRLLELTNLILYRAPIIDSIRYTSRKYATYLYCFDYRGKYHRFGHLTSPLPFEIDATLSDDNIYLFPYPSEVSQLNAEDKTISRVMTTMWTNFARYSIPNLTPDVWPNVTTEFGKFLRITNAQGARLELDDHFSEGIPVPNVYPEYFTTTTTTTQRPHPNYPHYPNQHSYQEQQQRLAQQQQNNQPVNERYAKLSRRHQMDETSRQQYFRN